MSKALILVNIGTPDKPEKKAVKRYLSEFLNDKWVIDIPWLLRKILVNLIIIPFRVNKSTQLYKSLWTSKGSPLLIYQNSLAEKLKAELGEEFDVYSAMRYGIPSIAKVLADVVGKNYQELIVLPMYPQYATSTTLSTLLKVEDELNKLDDYPSVKFIDQFYNHPSFINAFVSKIKACDIKKYDHIVFSYHGLPDRQVNKMHPNIESTNCSCHIAMPEHGINCYKATCYETSRLLAKGLGIENSFYSVAFQSRLSKNWLTPFTDEKLKELLKIGKRSILVVAPAFVTDCLETIIEIGFEYKEMFLEEGGVKLEMVESLNDSEVWVKAIADIVKQ